MQILSQEVLIANQHQRAQTLRVYPEELVISFYQGRTFIRDNIVVNVHAEGEPTTKVKEIVQEIDEIILTHKTFQTENKVRPYIIVDNNGYKTIVEP